jgi:hypothetical protein
VLVDEDLRVRVQTEFSARRMGEGQRYGSEGRQEVTSDRVATKARDAEV